MPPYASTPANQSNAAEGRQVEAEHLAREQAEAERIAQREAREEAERLAAEEERRVFLEARENNRITKARTLKHIEGIPEDLIDQLNQVSADYILDHPEEFLTQTFNARNLGAFRDVVKLLSDDTNVLMLYAAVSSDLDVIKAIVDTGIDLNAQNKRGYGSFHQPRYRNCNQSCLPSDRCSLSPDSNSKPTTFQPPWG